MKPHEWVAEKGFESDRSMDWYCESCRWSVRTHMEHGVCRPPDDALAIFATGSLDCDLVLVEDVMES